MRYIKLTQGQRAKVDDDLYEWLNHWTWCAKWYPKYESFYAVRAAGAKGNRFLVPMHRQILGLDSRDHKQGDHRDRDTLNNQRKNLRAATPSQNQMNKGRQRNQTGFKGVRPSKTTGKFTAAIKANGKYEYLGTFSSVEAAHKAYCDASTHHYGDFARHG